MIKIAKIRGLNKLIACVRRDNASMLKVFENSGFIRQYSEGMDEVELELPL
jgi:L-amino acid N-acyltransferase YncA